MSKHASKAKAERNVKDVINNATGHPEKLGAGLAAAYGAYVIAHKTGIDKVITNAAKHSFKKASQSASTAYVRHMTEQMVRRTMG